MAHQVYPGGRRRVRIPELARDLVTGEWQRGCGRGGGLGMSASTVARYRDLLVRLDVIRRVPWGSRGRHANGKRFGDRFTAGRQFWAWFGRGRFTRTGLLVALVRAALVRAFGFESVPMTSFVLSDSRVSSRRTVEKVPAPTAPADIGTLSPPGTGQPVPPGRSRAVVNPQTVSRGEERREVVWPNPTTRRASRPYRDRAAYLRDYMRTYRAEHRDRVRAINRKATRKRRRIDRLMGEGFD